MARSLTSWDIFCRVVDNFGDIGVCWRLARQLNSEYGLQVRLIVDDLSIASRIIPLLVPQLQIQQVEQITIQQWTENFADVSVADVVIEAFACELPQHYLHAMLEKKPVWLNLEYLSAETWVNDFHAKSSPHPHYGLIKYFFFPGFNPHTGGLIREKSLIDQRNFFQQSETEKTAFWQSIGTEPQALNISLFCYPHAPIALLLEAMAQSPYPVLCLVPQSGNMQKIANYFGKNDLKIGEKCINKQLTLQILPFLSQSEYDRLLWACDINFVRGEDSWIRAIWAGKPFVWQPYLQIENTHLLKLDAFLDIYSKNFDPCLQKTIRDLHIAWCGGDHSSQMASPQTVSPRLWQFTFEQLAIKQLPTLQMEAAAQSQALAKQVDLAAKLVIFCKNLL